MLLSMKKFLKMVLAVICGVLIVSLVGIMILNSTLTAALTATTPAVPASGILKIDLSKVAIVEQTSPALSSSSQNSAQVGLLQAVSAIDAAASDPGVSAIYLRPDGFDMGVAQMQELRSALRSFRSSGKPVVSYMENPTTGSYYLASVSDKIYMTSAQGGTPLLIGVSSQLMFFGDLLDRLGIKVQLIRHGKYKSGGETYTRGSASKENLHQNQVLVDALWASLRSEIASGRSIAETELDGLIDNLSLCLPQDFVEYGLVDELVDRRTLEEKLAILDRKEDFSEVGIIPFDMYANQVTVGNPRSHKTIAIVYANGNIVDGLDKQNVDGDRFASIIEDIRKDDDVKAVVLRVNSPGGSVVASEKIRTELDRLAEEKILVASYGNYAASGGYWISSGAQKIYCDAATLTGSIGVFGMVPDFSEFLSEKAHVGVQSVSSNAHGDMFTMTRPFTPEEKAWMQRSIESVYTKFLGIVSEGRDMTPEQVDELAQGRVWAGSDAVQSGLADEIGTLKDALLYAAAGAGDADFSAWNIAEYPAPQTLMDVWMDFIGQGTDDYSVSLSCYATSWFENWKNGNCEYVFATMPFIPVIK